MTPDKPAIIILPPGTPIPTEHDDLGPVPDADMSGDQTGGMGPL